MVTPLVKRTLAPGILGRDKRVEKGLKSSSLTNDRGKQLVGAVVHLYKWCTWKTLPHTTGSVSGHSPEESLLGKQRTVSEEGLSGPPPFILTPTTPQQAQETLCLISCDKQLISIKQSNTVWNSSVLYLISQGILRKILSFFRNASNITDGTFFPVTMKNSCGGMSFRGFLGSASMVNREKYKALLGQRLAIELDRVQGEGTAIDPVPCHV
ncbi:hypothetical protein J6590_095730 [Homalodisca vitripennis]|nr:hypothetical protein J6590_095730 [Homalodisca vitripennis]